MSIYRRKYWVTTKAGVRENRKQAFYTVEVRHPQTHKIVRRRGPKDRKSAQKMEVDLLTELERGSVGLSDPFREFRAKPFQDSIDAFIRGMEAEQLDDKYIYTTRKRLERVALEAGWKTIFDATLRTWETWRSATAAKGWNDRPTKPKTLNQFLATLMEFFEWCVDTDRMEHNPLRKASKAREIQNEDYRRAAKPEEVERFLKVLPSDDLRRFYVFLAYTALRRAALEHLKWHDLSFDPSGPYVTVRAESNKTRRTQRFAIRRDVAAMMAEARGDRPGSAKVFPHVPTIDEHREYLAAAGIPFDEDGVRRLDLHAFRKTLHTWLEDAGVDVREASKALGHLHLSTTMKSYRERRDARPDAGVERLPPLPLPAAPVVAENPGKSRGGTR